jgi:rhamnose transport system permease protein
MQISQFWIDALTGLFILLAVTSDAIILNRLRNLWARSERQLTEVSPTPQRSADGERA